MSNSPSVLLVDDEPGILRLHAGWLQPHGYATHIATSASEGLLVLEAQHVDVVISDEVMPGQAGSEFLTTVRRRFPNVTCIILTGHASLDAAVRAVNDANVFRFLTKPCAPDEFFKTVAAAVRHNRLTRLARHLEEDENQRELLERQYPGITSVSRLGSGEIVLDDLPEETLDDLLARAEASHR